MTLIANELISVQPMPFPFGVSSRSHIFDDIRVKNLSDYSINFQKKLMQDLFDTAFEQDFEGFSLPPFKIYKSPFENDDEYKIMPG